MKTTKNSPCWKGYEMIGMKKLIDKIQAAWNRLMYKLMFKNYR